MFGMKSAYLLESGDVWRKRSAERGAWRQAGRQDWAWEGRSVLRMSDANMWLQPCTCCQTLLAPLRECDSLLGGIHKFPSGRPLQENASVSALRACGVLWQEIALGLGRSPPGLDFTIPHLLCGLTVVCMREVRSALFGSTLLVLAKTTEVNSHASQHNKATGWHQPACLSPEWISPNTTL